MGHRDIAKSARQEDQSLGRLGDRDASRTRGKLQLADSQRFVCFDKWPKRDASGLGNGADARNIAIKPNAVNNDDGGLGCGQDVWVYLGGFHIVSIAMSEFS